MTDKPQEQRRYPRIPAEKAVLVKKIGDEASEALAKTQTVGRGGCMFIHHEPLGVGSGVELLISFAGRVMRAQGKVVWEVVTEPGRVEVGVEFLRISPRDKKTLESALAEQTAR